MAFVLVEDQEMVEILLYNRKQNAIVTDKDLPEAHRALEGKDDVLWVDIQGFDSEAINKLEQVFGFHPLAIEDCIGTSQRPKIDNYENYLFVVLHAAYLKPKKVGLETIELNSFVGTNYIVTVRDMPIVSIDFVKERCKKNPALMGNGSGELFYLIADAMIDNYFPILDKLDKEIDVVEQSIFDNPTHKLLDRVFSLKNDILALRRLIYPQREIINFLARGEYPIIGGNLKLYFRDVGDGLARIIDILDNYRDILASAMDGYLSAISNKTNEVMKVLTIIATIMMPLTLITGIYGMNFAFMPELRSPYGYYATLFVMFLLGVGMVLFFKRKKWL
jgi:magnesium transporter